MRSLAGASRFCTSEMQLPDPLRDPDGFVNEVLRIVRDQGVELLLPISEAALLALLPARDRFYDVNIPFDSIENVTRICDKAEVMEVARGLGIDIPRQERLYSPAALSALRSGTLSFPLVVKPARSVVGLNGARAKSSVAHAYSLDQVRDSLSGLPADAFPVLLQERIIGPGVGVFLLIWKGEVRASFFHRRIREKPPSGGVSVLRESIAPDPALLKLSVDLLREFAWQGVAMVEYKIDASTGKAYLMEINGRFWGSLQLAVDAGVDFPRLLIDAALGEALTSLPSYRPGVRSRWWWGDVDHLIARMRSSRTNLALPEEAPGRLNAVLQFLLTSVGATRNEIFRLDDPLPALRESIGWFRRS